MAAHYSVIAIDGPAASGKSSVARRLAAELQFAYVNSGSLYRAVAWLANDRAVKPDDSQAVARLLRQTSFRFDLRNNASVVSIDGVDPEPYLRSEAVNSVVSKISALNVVREFLLGPLRRYAERANLIMEGRDIGSAVFPDTPYKFYIDASPEVRARRRAAGIRVVAPRLRRRRGLINRVGLVVIRLGGGARDRAGEAYRGREQKISKHHDLPSFGWTV